MLEKPNLADETIIASLREGYAIPAVSVEFLPIGNDATAWVYRVRGDNGSDYFLKVKRGLINQASLTVPRYLKDHGIAHIVAPLYAQDHALWQNIAEFTLILYPFIVGENGMDVGLSDSHWREHGAALKAIHSQPLPDDLLNQMRRETFVPKFADIVKHIDARLDTRIHNDAYEQELAAIWQEKRAVIRRVLNRAETLGHVLQNQTLDFVLCHADIHTANILVTNDAEFFIVDWDEAIIAPKERDLMFIIGGTVGGEVISKAQEDLFFASYGQADINRLALAYYRYEWCVQDIGDYAERMFLTPDTGAETKADAIEGFLQLFSAGDVVDAATASEQDLPPDLRA